MTLVRDTYRSGDNVRELLDFCDAAGHGVSREDIEDHLLDRVLPAAYALRPGEAPPRYELQAAQRALGQIAARMNQDGTRDLAWWRIPAWTSRVPRVIVTGLVVGLVVGLGLGLGLGFQRGLVDGNMGWFPYRLLLMYGLGYGLVGGLVGGLGLVGLASVRARGRVVPQTGRAPAVAANVQPLVARRRPRVRARERAPVSWVVGGLAGGLVVGLVVGLALVSRGRPLPARGGQRESPQSARLLAA